MSADGGQTASASDQFVSGETENDNGSKREWDVHWNRGIRYSLKRDVLVPWRYGTVYQYEEMQLAGKVGARFHIDSATYSEHSLEGVSDETDLRRGRIYTQGNLVAWYPVEYKLEFGFVEDDFFFNDNYWWWKEIPFVGSIKLGYIKFPVGLERTESSRDLVFMERAAPVNALAPNFSFGVQFGAPALNDRMTWHLGWYGAGEDDPELGGTTSSLTRTGFRLTGLPILDEAGEDGTSLLHLGLGLGAALSFDDELRMSARPESFFAPSYINTGDFDADDAYLIGVELAGVKGPYSFQGEYLFSSVGSENFGRLGFSGFYLYGSWFPTGEHRQYNKERGVFTQVVPKNPFSVKGGGWGGLELGLRYSFIELNDDKIRGGEMHTIMTGVNWYIDRSVRLRFNYGLASVDNSNDTGWLQILQGRLQLDF